MQLLKEGKFVDYEAANKYEEELKAYPKDSTWEGINTKYKPILDGLLAEFTEAVRLEEAERDKEIDRIIEGQYNTSNNIVLIDLLRGKGLDYLNRHFSIFHRFHPEFPHLVQLCYDKQESPIDNPRYAEIVGVCNGVIVSYSNKGNGDWQAISLPFPLFDKREWGSFEFLKEDGHITPKTITVTRKTNGILCVLYWHSGEWRLASRFSPDASEALQIGGKSVDKEERRILNSIFWERWKAKGYRLPPAPSFTGKGGFCSFLFQFETSRIGVFSGCEEEEGEKDKEGIVLLGVSSSELPSTLFKEGEGGWYEGWTKSEEVCRGESDWTGWADELELQNPLKCSGLVVKVTADTPATADLGKHSIDALWFHCDRRSTRFYVIDNPRAKNLELSLKELKREPSELTVVNLLR